MGHYWLNNKNELILLDDERYNDGYGGVVRNVTSVKSISAFHERVRTGDPHAHFLTIKCEWQGRTITMVDCDSPEENDVALEYLKSKQIDYAHFSSSTSKTWLFPGMSFSSFEGAHAFLSRIPGCDERYVKMAKDKGNFVIRGEAKEDEARKDGVNSQPKFLSSTVKDPAVKAFIEAIRIHFNGISIKNLTKLRLQGSGWPASKSMYGAWDEVKETGFMEERVKTGDFEFELPPTHREYNDTWLARHRQQLHRAAMNSVYNNPTEDEEIDDDFLNQLRNMR